LNILQDAVKEEHTQQEIALAIWRAGEQVMCFRMQTAGRFRRVGWCKPKITSDFVEDINKATDVSEKALTKFKEQPNLWNDWLLCESNRKATLLTFSARSGYDGQKDIEERFLRILKETVKAKEDYIKTLEKNDAKSAEKRLANMLIQSERRRCAILEAMISGDNMDEAYDLVWDDIEKSMQTRSEVLEVAIELEPEVRLWESSPRAQN
jgi:hypothetical protein